MTISIITVTHNSARDVPRYVASFLESKSGETTNAIEFVIVENSGHLAIEALFIPLREAGFRVLFMQEQNRGFGHACNTGAAAANGETLVFANPDLEFIDPLDPIEHHPDVGDGRLWATARQLNSEGDTCSFDALPEHKTVVGELCRRYRRLNVRDAKWEGRLYTVGSFFIVSRDAFAAVGGFDERFFLYYEETHLSRKLLGCGYRPVFFEDMRVRHRGFGSAANERALFTHETNGLFTYVKLTGEYGVLVTRLVVLLLGSFVNATARLRLGIFLKSALRFPANGAAPNA